MRIVRIGMGLILVLFCVYLQAETRVHEMTVTGKLTRVMAIGGESTGWAIQLESEIAVDGKQVSSIEVDYPASKKLDKWADKRVKATGRISHRHGVEMGGRVVLNLSSMKEVKESESGWRAGHPPQDYNSESESEFLQL
jgi:hypothetical protein